MSREGTAAPRGRPKKRSESKAETRQAIIAAAIDAYVEEGLDAPSLDAICARAGKTRGAFYVHFQDRDELLAAVMAEVLGRFAGRVIGAKGASRDLEDTIVTFTKLAQTPGRLPGSRVPLHQVLAACERSPAVHRTFKVFLQLAMGQLAQVAKTGQASSGVRRDVAPESIGALLVALVLGLNVLRSSKVNVPLEGVASDLVKMLTESVP